MAKTRISSQKAATTEDGLSVQTPLETYLREINETSLLSAQDERELAAKIGEGDIRARDRMVRANLRLVVNIEESSEHCEVEPHPNLVLKERQHAASRSHYLMQQQYDRMN